MTDETNIITELDRLIQVGIKFERGDLDAQPYATVQTLLAA